MWERTLQDLIKGLRNNKGDEAKFIAQAVDEIRQEIRTPDMELKAGAVLKLIYLDMLGYDMGWASFHVLEVMSSPKYHLKCVGYLAAVQSFTTDTDVLMLMTNTLKKDLSSSPSDVSLALNGISHVVTPELGRDLAPELIAMLSHSRSHIRKRALIALYKVFLKYPDAIPAGLPRLREKLQDSDPSVVATTINVLCEMVRKSLTEFLTLAPPLFHLMQTSSNNWMLIKIIKLFGVLCPHEPRLVKKLQGPITELISTTNAISLLYECVHTCIIGGMLSGLSGDSLAQLCVTKLATFIEDSDQNLKYIAFLAMAKIVPTHAYLIAGYQDTILASLNDADMSIRMRTLDLVSAMANSSNLQSIVQQILTHLESEATTSLPSAEQSITLAATSTSGRSAGAGLLPSQSPAYRLALCQCVLDICSRSMYENVVNFDWYLSVLVDLAHIARAPIGPQLRDQLVDVVGRVKATRRFAVRLMRGLIMDDSSIIDNNDNGCMEVLWAAAWICSECASELSEPQEVITQLLRPEVMDVKPDIIVAFIQAAMKIFGHAAANMADQWDEEYLPDIKAVVANFLSRVNDFAHHPDIEVQERAANALQLFGFIQADLNTYQPKPESAFAFAESSSSSPEPRFPKSLYLIKPLTSAYELGSVAPEAQARVPIPAGLDLDAWIVPPPVEEEELPKAVKKSKKGKGKEVHHPKSRKAKNGVVHGTVEALAPVSQVETPEETAERERRKAERLERLKDDPYYIIDRKTPSTPADDIDSIPVVQLEGMPSLLPNERSPYLPSNRHDRYTLEPSPEPFVVDREGEMPEGVIAPAAVPPSTAERDQLDGRSLILSSFPSYEVSDNCNSSTPAPAPIKVKSKRK
ncbi:Adaptor protein complex AP-3 delta subunit, partial [Fistulina hepatica ATCC 64428]